MLAFDDSAFDPTARCIVLADMFRRDLQRRLYIHDIASVNSHRIVWSGDVVCPVYPSLGLRTEIDAINVAVSLADLEDHTLQATAAEALESVFPVLKAKIGDVGQHALMFFERKGKVGAIVSFSPFVSVDAHLHFDFSKITLIASFHLLISVVPRHA